MSYTAASLEAEMDMLAGLSQGANRDVGRSTISPVTPLTGAKGGEAQLVNACVLSVYSLFCTGAHKAETPVYRSVCLVRCNSDWSAGICSTLHYQSMVYEHISVSSHRLCA